MELASPLMPVGQIPEAPIYPGDEFGLVLIDCHKREFRIARTQQQRV